MGIFSRMKRAVKSKTNAAIDRAVDPEKELDMAIYELEQQQKEAMKELLGYKTSVKQMEQDLARAEQKAGAWEKRAIEAVKGGDDELAKKALREQKQCAAEAARIRADRDEAAGYAIELNRSRKQFETRLRILKLKKGTMAAQLAAARRGGGDTFGDAELWDRFERAEQGIDEEAIEAEVQAAMEGEELSDRELEAKLLQAGAEPGPGAGDSLEALKARMAADKKRRLEAARDTSARALPRGERGDDAGE